MSQTFKIQYKKETHIYHGESNFETLCTYVKSAFKKKLPQEYVLTYTDEENDEITISCQGDFDAMKETNNKKTKLIIKEFVDSSASESEEEKKQNFSKTKCPFQFDEKKWDQSCKNMQGIFKEIGKQFETSFKNQFESSDKFFEELKNLEKQQNEKEFEQKIEKGFENFFENININLNKEYKQEEPKQNEQEEEQKQEEENTLLKVESLKIQKEDEIQEKENEKEEVQVEELKPEIVEQLQEQVQVQQEEEEKEDEKEHLIQKPQIKLIPKLKSDCEKIPKFGKVNKELKGFEVIKGIFNPQKKEIKKKEYSQEVKDMAVQVSEIMGSGAEQYYGICEVNLKMNRGLEAIITTLIEQPHILKKYPSLV